MALGGQGAPLVPAFHQALLAHPVERRMVLNIGGIANLSLLVPGQPVRGYDTGPGNMLMDAWIWRQCGKPYDKDAQWASEGKVLLPLLQDMLSDPWFALPAPKSTGREYFNYGWLEKHLARYANLRGQDVQATLTELTAVTISEQVLLSGGCERLLVCGGGARNPLLMARLAALLPVLKSRPPMTPASAATIWKRWPLRGWHGVRLLACRVIFLPLPAPAKRPFLVPSIPRIERRIRLTEVAIFIYR